MRIVGGKDESTWNQSPLEGREGYPEEREAETKQKAKILKDSDYKKNTDVARNLEEEMYSIQTKRYNTSNLKLI